MDSRSLLKRLLFCLLVFFTLGVTPAQSQSCQSCVLVTDPSASQAFSAGNGAAVNLNSCGLHVDSSSSTALSVTGGAKVKASSIRGRGLLDQQWRQRDTDSGDGGVGRRGPVCDNTSPFDRHLPVAS